MHKTKLRVNNSTQGETLEVKIERMINNKEPIKDSAPLIYTERKDGVVASTNIRTDRFDLAIDAADKIAKSHKAKVRGQVKPKEVGKPESTQGEGSTGTTEKAQ